MSNERDDLDRLDSQMERSLDAAAGETPDEAPAPPPAPPVEPPSSAPPPPSMGSLVGSLKGRGKQAAKTAQAVEDAIEYPLAQRLAVVGIGQGGGRLAEAFYHLGYRRVALLNTTAQDFTGRHEGIPRLSLSGNDTDKGGAAKDMQAARDQFSGRGDDVWDLLDRAWGATAQAPEVVLVCASLGGGTGGGLVDLVINLVRERLPKAMVGAVVSLPRYSEGPQISRNATLSFRRLTQMDPAPSPVIVIDNGRIHEIPDQTPAAGQLHNLANAWASHTFHLFNMLAARQSEHITFDQAEFEQLLRGGLVTMGVANVSDPSDPQDMARAVREQTAGSMLAEIDPGTADKAACVFVAHPDALNTLSMDYFDAGYEQVDRLVKADAIVHRGLYDGGDPGVFVYTMFSGLDIPREALHRLAEKGGLLHKQASQFKVASWLGIG